MAASCWEGERAAEKCVCVALISAVKVWGVHEFSRGGMVDKRAGREVCDVWIGDY